MKKNKNRYIQSFRKGAGDKTSSAPDHWCFSVNKPLVLLGVDKNTLVNENKNLHVTIMLVWQPHHFA